jgi:hypothetical protein
MAKVRKRVGKKGVSWQIDYYDPNRKRVWQSFDKKKDAEAELGKRVSLIAENRYLDVKKEYRTTLGNLLDKYEENFKHQASFPTAKVYFIKKYKDYFGEQTLLANIRYVNLETYRTKLKNSPTLQGKIRSDAAVDRQMVCLHHILKRLLSGK